MKPNELLQKFHSAELEHKIIFALLTLLVLSGVSEIYNRHTGEKEDFKQFCTDLKANYNPEDGTISVAGNARTLDPYELNAAMDRDQLWHYLDISKLKESNQELYEALLPFADATGRVHVSLKRTERHNVWELWTGNGTKVHEVLADGPATDLAEVTGVRFVDEKLIAIDLTTEDVMLVFDMGIKNAANCPQP